MLDVGGESHYEHAIAIERFRSFIGTGALFRYRKGRPPPDAVSSGAIRFHMESYKWHV